MATHQMPLLQRMLHRISYRITHKTKLPKAEILGFCRQLAASGFYPRHIVDIGANRGRWSTKARKVFPKASFTLVEPQIEMKPALDAFCSQAEDLRWINAGAGAAEGELAIALSGPTTSSFALSDEEIARGGWETRKVRIITLDWLCAEVIGAIPEMVKLDAEGFELEILEGARSLLGKTELFLLEVWFLRNMVNVPDFRETVECMSDHGYEPFDFTWFHRPRLDGPLVQCEMAFARRDGILRDYPNRVDRG